MVKAKIFLLGRYLIVAALVYGLDMGGYILLINHDINPLAANIVVKVIAATFGFFAHRRFTYQIKNYHNIVQHSIRYFALALVYTPTATGMLFVFLKFIPNIILAKFICDILLFIALYWINSKFTFFKDQTLTQQSLS